MRILAPWWLLAILPAVALVVVIARHGRRSVSPRQHRVATVVRSVGVVLLVLALAQPLLVHTSGTRSVLFLLDRSSSITDQARAAQEEYVQEAATAAGLTDHTAIAVFGRDVRLDEALSTTVDFTTVHTVVDESATDLASALRSAAAVMPTEGSRRIVVLTDTVETTGDARAAARELADAGIAVDVVSLVTGRSLDALIDRVDAPSVAREGETVPVDVVIEATAAGPAVVTVTAGETEVEVPVDLEVGTNRVTVEVPATSSGVMRVVATVAAGFDRVPENDRGEALVHVLGPAQVAVVEGKIGDGEALTAALEAAGMEVDVLTAVPDAGGLLSYDGVVLVNVPNPGDDVAADLASYVEDLGRGLVVVGGDQAYGLGDYQDSALEEILPVSGDPDDLVRRQPVAEVLVIDTSGSMAACHCESMERHNETIESGVNKTDISRAGAGLAIEALQDSDRIGVLAFTSGTRWALPLEAKPDQATIDEALGSLVPQGDTEISAALREALTALRDAPEEIRHIVLFTDGWGDDPDLLDVAQQIAADGITLSVLGTGEGTGEMLRRMAALGGGQFYPGRDLDAVPEIFVEETLRVARPLVAEGSFLPALGAASQVTSGLTASPPLQGYVLTRPKPAAQIALEIGPGDPLLASWQRGLGRATAWTSDATGRWSADWLPWDGFVDFWGRVVSEVLPAGRETPPEVRFDGGALAIGFEADASLDAVGVAQVRAGDGDVTAVPMQRTGESRFEARVPVTAAGAYWVAVQVEDGGAVVASGSSGVVAGYSDEFAFREADPSLAGDVAEATGGRLDPVATAAYDTAPRRGAAEIGLWPWLAALALALFLLDVTLRRLVVSRGDLAMWRAALRRTSREPVRALETGALPVAGSGRGPDAIREEAPSPPGEAVDHPAPPSREVYEEEHTLGRLLRRKRS